MWDIHDKDPERARRFAGAMELMQSDPGFDIKHIVNGYDWASVGSGTVVDIGGSTGAVMTAICTAYPQLHAIVQELPQTVAQGPQRIPQELSKRIEFMAHDFFTEQPVKGADVYMFRWILHDWSDTYAVKIFKALAPAMRESSKLLIWDSLVPQPGQVTAYEEESIRFVYSVCFNTLQPIRELTRDSIEHSTWPCWRRSTGENEKPSSGPRSYMKPILDSNF